MSLKPTPKRRILILVLLSLAAVVRPANSHKPCCWPNQISGVMVATTPNMHLFSMSFYADFEMGMVMEIAAEDAGIPFVLQLRNLNINKKYIKYHDGTCEIVPLLDLYVQCMPDDAKLVNILQVEEGGKTRDLVSWSFTAPQVSGGFQGRLVYADNCFPFIYRFDDPMVSFKFENVVDRIEDPSIFDVDLTNCQSVD